MSRAAVALVPAQPQGPKRPATPRGAGPAGSGRAPWWHGALFVGAMLSTVPLVNAHIRSDGNEYYAYVRSVVIDHDLQFDDEYAHAEDTFKGNLDGELALLPNGYRRNFASVGPSLLWTPFFLAGHVVAHVLTARGHPVPIDGFSWPYVWACAFGTTFYTFIGLWLSYRMASRFASSAAALLAAMAIWLASSLPVYLYFLPFHAHAVASFTIAWFLWNWFKARDGGGRWRWFVWGLSAGLATCTYYLNAAILVVAILEWLSRLGRLRELREHVIKGLVFTSGLVVAMLPATIVKMIVEGSVFATGYIGPQFAWSDPRLAAVAFSPEHGALLWTPVLIPALLGLIWLCRRAPAIGVILAIETAVFYYLVAAYRNWHGHSSFGNRFLTALTPIFVIGLGVLIDAMMTKRATPRRWAAACGVAVLLIAWNIGFMFQWGVNVVPNRGPVDMAAVVRNQFTVVPREVGRFLGRYFTSRASVVREVEQGDLKERPLYKVKR